MNNYKLTVCYDGTRYKGWQKQGNTGLTIQGKLEEQLSRLLGEAVEVAGCGRTDAGVHARAQVCSFHASQAVDCGELLASLRETLPEDIGAVSLEEAPPRFHARLSCTEKTYVYRIWNSAEPDVFQRRYRLSVPQVLDLSAMRKAAALLCGRHDFAAFCTARPGKKSTVRELRSVDFQREGDELRLVFTGDGFLYNMVRILTGTLLEVGLGARSPESVADALGSLDRTQAGPTAPAKGLILWQVRYGNKSFCNSSNR